MLDRLFAWIASITPAPDKVAHFSTGTIGAFVTVWFSLWVSIPIIVTIAVSKEFWDAFNPPHQSDKWDAVATILGALPIWIVWGFK